MDIIEKKHKGEKPVPAMTCVPLGTVAKAVSGIGFPKELQGLNEGEYPVFKAGEISRAWMNGEKYLDESGHNLTHALVKRLKGTPLPAGTTVFAKIGEGLKLNRRMLLARPSLVDNNVMGLVPGEDIDAEYLYYFMTTVDLGALSQATAVPSVRKSDIDEIEVPHPPLPQQRRIVEAIELQLGRLDAAVARLQGAKARLKRYKQAVLKAAFADGDYPVTTIGEVYEVFVGSTPSRNKPELWNGPIYWVSSGEVAFCDIEDTRERITEEGLGNRATRLHPPGTVMLAMIGEGKTRGQAAILRVPAAHNQNTAAIRMPAPEYSPEYLYFYFMYEYDNTRRVGGGNNQMALNKSRIQAIEIPMPDPDEQTRIAAAIKERFATVDETEATLDAQLQQAVRLRQAVLNRAFEGRLG